MSATTLQSIRVLDLSSPVGTYCTRLLADLGADVVLVEPPEGDPYRRLGPFRSGASGPDASLAFGYYQAGKRSIVLDTDDAADRAVLEGLGRDADVVVISPSPARPTPGFDAATLSLAWASPDAIVCSVTPFGVTGPYARRPATHLTSFAQSGQMWRVGPPGTPPVAVPANLHWHLASAHATVAVLAALAVRDLVGGQFVDISAQEVEQYQDVLWERYDFQGLRHGARTVPVGVPPTGVWECRDGLFDVAAHQVQHWEAFLEMLGHPQALAEPALADMTTRQQIFDGVADIVASLLAPRSRYELFDTGQRVGLPVGLRNTPAQFVDDEQLAARDFWIDLGRPETGPIRAPGPAVRTSPTLFEAAGPAPVLDEHGAMLRAEARPARPTESRTVAQPPPRPLEGLRVLSLGEFVAGNFTAQILAALGADVAKIESRSRPSVVRMQPYNDAPTLAVEPSGATNTPMYASFSRGARGVAIEMGTDEGRDVFRRLAAVSDVVLENFGASVMAHWGCAYDDLHPHNPRLVMASLSGYGRTGPRAAYLAYGSNIANFTGIGDAWWTDPTYGDFLTAAHTVVAILAARRHVVATGEGVLIDASQVEVVASLAASLYLDVLVNGEDHDSSHIARDDGALLHHVFSCAGDDRWAVVEATTLEHWNASCDVVERPDLRVDSTDAATARRAELAAAIDAWAAERTTLSAAHLLARADVPAASVANTEESHHDPQLHHRHFPTSVDQPDVGFMSSPGTPYRLSVTPPHFDRAGPRVGQHTREVLHSWIAMSDDDVDALVDAGTAFDLGTA